MAFNSMGSLFYLLCQWLLTVVVVPLCSFEAAGILNLSISLTNEFFTLATFGIRIFQVSDSQGKYGPGLYISTRVFTCLCSFALCAAFLLCNRQYTAEQVLCILFYMLYRIGEALVDVLAGEEQKAYRFDYVGLSFLFRGLTTLLSFSLVLYCTRNLTLTLLVMAVMTLGVVLAYDGLEGQGVDRLPSAPELSGELAPAPGSLAADAQFRPAYPFGRAAALLSGNVPRQ